jgi:hypothetical protein
LHFPSKAFNLDTVKEENEQNIRNVFMSEFESIDEELEGHIDWTPSDSTFKPELSHLTAEQAKEIVKIIDEFIKTFASTLEQLGNCSLQTHKIRTIYENPIRVPSYRYSAKEREVLKEEMSKLLKAGIIRESRSSYSFPVIIIKKKDGSWRICIDYRKLNAATELECFPLGNILDILDRLSKSKVFTTVDLKSGYYQVMMDPDSIDKTAFSTPDGHYEFLRLPFGLKNAPSEFFRFLKNLLGHLPLAKLSFTSITSLHFNFFHLKLSF